MITDNEISEQLYEAYYMKVYSFVMTLAKSKTLSEEITQEVFFRAITTEKTFRGESGTFTWLCAIAKICSVMKCANGADSPKKLRRRYRTRVMTLQRPQQMLTRRFGFILCFMSWRNRIKRFLNSDALASCPFGRSVPSSGKQRAGQE